jgi:uncharacterized membrane protein YcaP (DUF421 family)
MALAAGENRMSHVSFFFSGWAPILRILVVGVAMYAALVASLRLSGSRTLSRMNVFDFIVTVAIGSAFGRALTATDVALAEAVAAFLLLVGLQYVVARMKTRSLGVERLVTNPPSLLYARGEFRRAEMRAQRVTEDELAAAVRQQHIGSLDKVEAIVLESSGEMSVITTVGDGSALDGLPIDRTD